MPFNSGEEKHLINDKNCTSLEKQTNETSLPKLLPAAPRSDRLCHPHLAKYNSVNHSHASCKHRSMTYTSLDSTNVNAIVYNEQSKYLPTGSLSLPVENSTGLTSKKQTASRPGDLNLNSQTSGGIEFSIKIPINHKHKLHIDPERIAFVTAAWPDQILGQGNTDFSDSSPSSTIKDENESIKSSTFVKYTFRSSPVDGNIIHLKSNVHVNKTEFRNSTEKKNIAVQCDDLRENCNLDSCKDLPIDAKLTVDQIIESEDTATNNTSVQAKSDTCHDSKCYFPVHFESSSSTNISLNCHRKKLQPPTEYHTFENSIEKSVRNIITDHTSSQLSQERNCIQKETQVSSKHIHTQTCTIETASSQELAALSSSRTKKPTHTDSTVGDSWNSLCDCVYFNDNSTSSDSGVTCGLCYTTDWSDTNTNSEDHNLSLDHPVKCSNPCQLSVACSRENCKCLLWTDSLNQYTHDVDARDISYDINNSQKQSQFLKIQNHYNTHGETNLLEHNSHKAALLKQNFVIEQVEKKSTIQTNDLAHRNSKEMGTQRQNRPSYKLSLDSNFSNSCKFAQRVLDGQREHRSDIATQGVSHAGTSTGQASVSCFKYNTGRKNESLKKVHISEGINSQIVSPLYKSAIAQNEDHNVLITSNRASNWTTHVLQNKDENKKMLSKHRSLEQQLKSKLRFGNEPPKLNENNSIFDDSFDFHNITGQLLILSSEEDLQLSERSVELPSATSCSHYVLTDSTPVTSITRTSSKYSMHSYENYSPSIANTSYALSGLSCEQVSENNLHKTASNLINTTFINSTIGQWKNNSISSLCNLSALDVSNEMDEHVRQEVEDRIFLSEVPIGTSSKMSSSTARKSDSDESIEHEFHSNNVSLSYPIFSNINTWQEKIYADADLANSRILEVSENEFPVNNICASNRTSHLKEPRPNDMLCKNTLVSKSQKTCMNGSDPIPVQKLTHKLVFVDSQKNQPGEISSTNRCINNPLEKYSEHSHKKLSENIYGVKSSKQMKVLYKQCTNNLTKGTNEHHDAPIHKPSSQGPVFPTEHISQIHATDTSTVEIYKNRKWNPTKLKKRLKIHKPNWKELSSTVNKLQMICNDHTEPSEQLKNSYSSESQSILEAQTCVQTLQNQLGI